MEELVGLLELAKKDSEFVRVGRISHLAEKVRRRERVADHPADRFAKLHLAHFARRSRATDGAEHDLDFEFVGSTRGQIGGRERATPDHVAVGILRPRPGAVGTQFQVAGVV